MTLGQARLIDGHTKYIHIVDLDQYKLTLTKLKETISKIRDPDVELLKNTTLSKFRNLETKLQNLYPFSRVRRGLINGLGSAIKVITGNMDSVDAENLNQAIEKIKLNEHDLKTQIDNQIVINDKINERLNTFTNFINYEQTKIGNALSNRDQLFTNEINRENFIIQEIQYLNQINYNIDILANHLGDISESIVLAKLNIISKFILQPDELEYIHQLFNNMSFSIQSEEHIFEVLELQAYYSDKKIIFNLNIPNFSKEIFKFTHLLQIPINSTETIAIEYPFIAHNNGSIHYFTDKCRRIEQTFICDKPSFQELIDNSQCIGKIIQGNDARCQHTDFPTMESVTRPEDDYILITNSKLKTVANNCGSNNAKIQGSVLIHFENCSITINNLTYTNSWKLRWDEIQITPIIFKQINKTGMLEKLTVEKLKNFHFENLSQIKLLQLQIDGHDYVFLGILATSIIIFIASILRLRQRQRQRQFKPGPVISYLPESSTKAPICDPTLRINWMAPI